MRKMVQSSRWLLQLVLLCQLWQLGTPCFGGPEHRSMGIYEKETSRSSVGQAYFFVLYVFVSEIGKKLDKGYTCPVYCDIDHKHIYAKKKSHIQGTDRILRSDEFNDREQSESDLRPIAGL